jgi:hypothetical protein
MNESKTIDRAKDTGCFGAAHGSASRLWRVTVEYELLVVADSERQAESEAEYYVGKDGSEPSLTVATKVQKIEDVPAEWQDSIPFGGDRKDERTCRERVTSRPNAKLTDGGTKPL